MKILHCINSLSSGGAEVFVCALAIAQKRAGCDVRVVAYGGTLSDKGKALQDRLEAAGVRYVALGFPRKWQAPIVPMLIAREFYRFRPDIVHSHLAQSDLFVWLASKLTTFTPVFVRTIHGLYVFEGIPLAVHGKLAGFFDATIACGEAVFHAYPYLGPRRRLINNGIDLTEFAARDGSRPRSSPRLGPPDATLFVSVGSFSIPGGTLVKGQDLVVHAMEHFRGANVHVAFVGGGVNRPDAEALVKSLGLTEKFTFVGQVTNAIDYVYAADAILMPSRSEGLSIACLEAVCAGKPVILSDIPAFASFRRSSSVMVEPRSSDSLAEGIAKFLADKTGFQTRAVAEREGYRREFDIHAVADRYIGCYRELAG